MTELRDEHLEVISKNKGKAHEEQKEMRDELAFFCDELYSLSNARVVLRNEKNEKKVWQGRKEQ